MVEKGQVSLVFNQGLKKLSPAHISSYVQSQIRKHKNQKFEKSCRDRIKVNNFSIICSTCIGGVIYHRLGMQFLSPTINLWFYQGEFIRFIRDLPHYMAQELNFVPSEWDFPVAKLDDVRIMFNHAKTEDEAREAWNSRRSRINYDNLYIILYDRDGVTREDIESLRSIPCKRLVVLSEREYPDLDYVKTIHKPPKPRPNDCTFLDKDEFGMRTFEKQFDFIAWLNGENIF